MRVVTLLLSNPIQYIDPLRSTQIATCSVYYSTNMTLYTNLHITKSDIELNIVSQEVIINELIIEPDTNLELTTTVHVNEGSPTLSYPLPLTQNNPLFRRGFHSLARGGYGDDSVSTCIDFILCGSGDIKYDRYDVVRPYIAPSMEVTVYLSTCTDFVLVESICTDFVLVDDSEKGLTLYVPLTPLTLYVPLTPLISKESFYSMDTIINACNWDYELTEIKGWTTRYVLSYRDDEDLETALSLILSSLRYRTWDKDSMYKRLFKTQMVNEGEDVTTRTVGNSIYTNRDNLGHFARHIVEKWTDLVNEYDKNVINTSKEADLYVTFKVWVDRDSYRDKLHAQKVIQNSIKDQLDKLNNKNKTVPEVRLSGLKARMSKRLGSVNTGIVDTISLSHSTNGLITSWYMIAIQDTEGELLINVLLYL